jgi:glycerate kinase
MAVVEAAEAIPLDARRRDPLRASSRGLGELVAAALSAAPAALIVCLGGTATVDGGAGLREVVGDLRVPTTAACDVDVPLLEAAWTFAPQKGAGPAEVEELARRLASMTVLASHAERPGAGAAGGLGAALAALGAVLVPGAAFILDSVGFDPEGYALVVTGEGTVDHTTPRGKAPAEVARRCSRAGVACIVFGGRVVEALPGVESVSLSGAPESARDDLVALGRRLAPRLADLLGQ